MDDPISRQAAINALKETFNPSITKFVQAKLAIENLPSAQPEQRWIPCSERLPEVGQVVLRTVKGFSWNGEKYISVDVGIYNTNDGSILAWMPLPEPYAERRTDE